QEYARRRRVAELAIEIAGVIVLADDDGALGGNQAPDAVQRLAQQRGRAEQGRVLLGPVLPEQTPHERSEPTPLTAGEDDGPGPSRWIGAGRALVRERESRQISDSHSVPLASRGRNTRREPGARAPNARIGRAVGVDNQGNT